MCAENNFPKDNSCIFCKIVAGAIPCHKLYEDDSIICFLDVGPLSNGHALVIPKGHWQTIDKVPENIAGEIGKVLPKLSRAIKSATQTPDWNILQNNGKIAHQEVGHVHFHIIPKTDNEGLGITWRAKELDKQKAIELKEAIGEQMQ